MNSIKIQNRLDGNLRGRMPTTGRFSCCFCLEFDLQIAEVICLYGFSNQVGVAVEPVRKDTVWHRDEQCVVRVQTFELGWPEPIGKILPADATFNKSENSLPGVHSFENSQKIGVEGTETLE